MDRCVFLSHCLLAQTFMAKGVACWTSSAKPVIEWCLDNEVNMIQLPCPETILLGLDRQPHGRKWYESQDFVTRIYPEVDRVISSIRHLVNKGRNVMGIIGVHCSPACSTNRGNSPYNPEGLFMGAIRRELELRQISIPMISIRRQWHKKMNQDLAALLK